MRVGLVVGNNLGNAKEERLSYAETDARRMADLFIRLGGLAGENTVLLQGRTAKEVRAALATLSDRLGQVPGEHLFLFYYSGHADGQALHLGGDSLLLSELKELALGLPATVRVLIVDACQSGALARLKGGQLGAAFQIDAGEAPPRGLAIMASSRDVELAQESDQLRGSFFTHHLHAALSGMADRDRDGRVSLAEAFDYAAERTLNATVDTWSPQHPMFRYDLTGQHDVVLTYPGTPGLGYGHLAFDRAGWYFVRGPRGSIVAEVVSGGGEELALEPGRYEVHRRAPGHLDVASVELFSGSSTRVSSLPTTRVAFGRVVRKGQGVRARAYAVSIGALARTSLASLGPSAGMTAAGRIDAAVGSLELRLAFAGATRATFVSSTTRDAAVSLAALRARDWGSLTVAGGLEMGWTLFHQQTALRPGAALAHGPVVGPTALVEVPVGARLHLRMDLSLPIYALTLVTERGERLSWRAAARLGVAAGGYF